jgi:2-keto-4-pentenoate hydratase/2-oxohepta-3-ene-1,7-dioic acid hydratase in catechol pathway
MKLASFRRADGSTGFGRVEGNRIVDLAIGPDAPRSLRAALAAGRIGGDGPALALGDVTLLPVIPDPGKIVCIGLNYETHRQETGRSAAGHPAVFVRWADTLVAHGAPLLCPAASGEFDYEGELAVIIGTAGQKIAAENALAHIAGFACFNDGSVRDWQRHNSQFTPGKNFPGTGGFGPWLVTPDEFRPLGPQRIRTRVNGLAVQDQPISDMIWPVPEIIAYVSAFTMLQPGDVIATGTPGGVGSRRDPPLWLKPGDTVEIAIDGIGVLRNPVVAG